MLPPLRLVSCGAALCTCANLSSNRSANLGRAASKDARPRARLAGSDAVYVLSGTRQPLAYLILQQGARLGGRQVSGVRLIRHAEQLLSQRLQPAVRLLQSPGSKSNPPAAPPNTPPLSLGSSGNCILKSLKLKSVANEHSEQGNTEDNQGVEHTRQGDHRTGASPK